MSEIIPQKYLVFAGSTDDENPKLGLDDLIGEMPIEEAYQAIKRHLSEHKYDNTGEVAIIKNGNVLDKGEYRREITYSELGKSLRGGFFFEDRFMLFENETIHYSLPYAEIETVIRNALEGEGGVFVNVDFSGWRMSIESTFDNEAMYSSLEFDNLTSTAEKLKSAIQNAVINSYASRRAWVAKGSPTFKATGVW